MREESPQVAGVSPARVKAEVTFIPDGGTPNTEDKKIKLVKR